MSLPKYAEYKDSGILWLERIPAHWLITKTKHVCEFSTGWTPPTGNDSAYEGENLWANISDLGPKILSSTAKRISNKAVDDAFIQVSPVGSLLFSFKLSVGQVSLAGIDMYTNEAIATFRASSKLVIDYAYYAFPIFLIKNATENIYGAKLLNQALIKSAFLPLPSLDEQSAIATFLDHETGNIDALIAEQEKLLTLLAEKRQATISHAVTRGLNPDAPMKDSGVPWLGEVPTHWDIFPTKRLFRVIVEPAPVNNHEELLSIYTSIGVRPRKSLKAKGNKATTTDGYWRVRKGDIIVNKLLAWMGAIGLSNYDGVTSPAYDILRKTKQLQPKYYDLLFRCGVMFSEFRRWSRGIMDMRLRLYFAEFGQISIPYPPNQEQLEIVEFLGKEAARLDALKHGVERAISGKIDVRGQSPVTEAACS
jgi:type I restriction enzyme S subunit